MKKILTVYYSWPNGNTERIARMLYEKIGGDMVRIDTIDLQPKVDSGGLCRAAWSDRLRERHLPVLTAIIQYDLRTVRQRGGRFSLT